MMPSATSRPFWIRRGGRSSTAGTGGEAGRVPASFAAPEEGMMATSTLAAPALNEALARAALRRSSRTAKAGRGLGGTRVW